VAARIGGGVGPVESWAGRAARPVPGDFAYPGGDAVRRSRAPFAGEWRDPSVAAACAGRHAPPGRVVRGVPSPMSTNSPRIVVDSARLARNRQRRRRRWARRAARPSACRRACRIIRCLGDGSVPAILLRTGALAARRERWSFSFGPGPPLSAAGRCAGGEPGASRLSVHKADRRRPGPSAARNCGKPAPGAGIPALARAGTM